MHFLSEDLLHIDTVLGQVGDHPKAGKHVFPLIHLVRQNLRLVTERVRFLEEGVYIDMSGDKSGGSSGGTDCGTIMVRHFLHEALFALWYHHGIESSRVCLEGPNTVVPSWYRGISHSMSCKKSKGADHALLQ